MKKAFFAGLAMASMLASAPLAGAMRAFDYELPSFSGNAHRTKARLERDGLGRRIKPKQHPRHNSNKTPWRRDVSDFKARVEATHSFNIDPRDDKYLHSHARQMRRLRQAMERRAA